MSGPLLTGPEHYAEAERLASAAETWAIADEPDGPAAAQAFAAVANVHVQLAALALTVDIASNAFADETTRAWVAAVGSAGEEES